MPFVRIEPLRDIPGGSSSTRITVTAQVYRDGKPAIRMSTDDVLVSSRISTVLNGPGQIELATLPADCYWRVSLRTRESYLRLNVVLPSSDSVIDFDELIEVDPSTAVPGPGETISDAFLAQIEADRIATEAARAGAEAARDGMVLGAHIDDAGNLIIEFADETEENLGSVAGVPGTGINILGSVPTPADLPSVGEDGDAYLIAGDLYVWAAISDTWENVGNIQGPKGDAGLPGPTGPQGVQGSVGPVGPKGDKGTKGDTGPEGPVGPQGSTGAQGTTGPQGIKGDTGAVGPAGAQGIKGNTGDQGPIGLTGAQGVAGADGEDGPIGPQGPIGPKGDKGDVGAKGNTGATGPTGPQGVKGDTGADGTGVTILGAFDNESELPATGDAGDGYLIDGALYVWSIDSSSWENVGNIQGPVGPAGEIGPVGPKGDTGDIGPIGLTGDKGETGATGAAGANGAKGDQGIQGIQGIQGATGPQGIKGDTGAKGDTGTAGAKGDTGAIGPQGIQGVKGDTGAQGLTGPQGLKGANWRGEWAFNVTYVPDDLVQYGGAVWISKTTNTFSTCPDHPNDWALFADKGQTGATGPTGAKGDTGTTGAKGDTGLTGPTGPQGIQGIQGVKGDTGLTGPQGTTGAQGIQGIAGPKGDPGLPGAAGIDGLGLNFRGYFEFPASYVKNDLVHHEGNAWIATGPTTATWPGELGSNWEIFAQKGDTGAAGSAGAQGVAGPQGIQGVQGNTGPAGSNAQVTLRNSEHFKVPAQGAVIFGFDDGYVSQYALINEIEARGIKCVWYIISGTIGQTTSGAKMTAANILDLQAKGHEIASHSVTHGSMAPMTEAARYAEFANSKSTLETLLRTEKPTATVDSFAYPLGSSNAAADSQAHGIYGNIRQVSTGVNLSPITPMGKPIPFSHAGYSFGAAQSNVDMSMELIRMAASQPVIVSFFIHQPNTAGEPTTAQILAAMDLCNELGVPVLTAREAFGRQTLIRNPNFDRGLNGWIQNPGSGTITLGSKHATLASNIVTLASTADSGQSPYMYQLMVVEPKTTVNWAFRAIVNRTSGTGGLYARIRWFDAKMTPLSSPANNASALYTTNAEGVVTANAVVPDTARFAGLDMLLTGMTGNAQVFHPYFGDAIYGNYA
jgi:peptidoglycan/xylan/chitin deacetylase (PgdA/CDA1 family)